MKFQDILIMIEIAQNEGKPVTTVFLGKKLLCSQQTISRKLRSLEDDGLVRRYVMHRGQIVTLTERGRELLEEIYASIGSVLKTKAKLIFSGRVTSGSGEGKYYMSLEGYRKQIIEKLGFDPYPGTLNIVLDDSSVRRDIERRSFIVLEGFSTKNRTFGEVYCYRCRISSSIDGSIVIPKRTHHPYDIVELIAPCYLRGELELKDGDRVNVEVVA